MKSVGFRVEIAEFRIEGLGFRIQGLGFRIQGLGSILFKSVRVSFCNVHGSKFLPLSTDSRISGFRIIVPLK